MVGSSIKVGIIGGSGLEDPENHFLKSRKQIKKETVKNDFGIPSSDLYEGTISGVDVVLLSRHGNNHKVIPTHVNYRANIEALRSLGCTHIIGSTACGSLSESIDKGQLVIPNSFIDRTIHRKNTFFDGTSENYSGICYVPMEPAFDVKTSKLLEKAGNELGLSIQNGATVVTIEGPRFSSKAESNMFRQWGGHLVNMTTCPEVILAKEAGLLYAIIAIATDFDCWKDPEDQVCANDVISLFKKNIEKVTSLLIKTVELIGQEKWDKEINDLKETLKNNSVSS